MDLITTATSTDEAARAASVAVLPVGSFEQHGAHLPLLTDTIVACAIAKEVAERYGLFLLPPVTISCSHEHAAWPGTVSISATTLAAVITDIASSLRESGIDRLAVINGHGGNYALANVVQEANVAGPRMTLFPARADWDDARVAAGLHSTAYQDMHAGELEVSLLLHVAPEVVRDGFQHADHLADDRRHLLTRGMSGYTTSGVIGLPSHAAAAKGKAVLDDLVRSFADHYGLLSSAKA
ncbi:creatininase family protein [Micromonospora tulbaghiae]|uniref:creatininase family protein n=1 Tax=Micromonospora tulbaghiae TaxID=479978 RepID=UPI003EBB583C